MTFKALTMLLITVITSTGLALTYYGEHWGFVVFLFGLASSVKWVLFYKPNIKATSSEIFGDLGVDTPLEVQLLLLEHEVEAIARSERLIADLRDEDDDLAAVLEYITAQIQAADNQQKPATNNQPPASLRD